MSGFLDRLIARHAETPSVRPRVLSRFEAAGREPYPAASEGAESSPPFDSEAGPRARREAPTNTEAREDAETADGRAHAAIRQERNAAGPDAHARLSPIVLTASDTNFAQPSPAAQQAGIERAAHEQHLASPAADVRTAASTVDSSLLLAALHAQRAAERAHQSREASVPLASRDPQVSARHAPVQPSEPDVVHVHIGRVEVRAVTQPAEQPRAARGTPAPAPLSLDRYLSGNSRR